MSPDPRDRFVVMGGPPSSSELRQCGLRGVVATHAVHEELVEPAGRELAAGPELIGVRT